MSENAPISNPRPVAVVTRGTVIGHVMTELRELVVELEQRRTLAVDLAAWFAEHPELDEQFGAFQRKRAAARAKLQRQAKPAKAPRSR